MTRADAHLDAMLRHLGAAYYESLHGRAARSDVARALDTVEEQLGEQGPPATKRHPARMAGSIGRRWHLRKQPYVRLTADVLMTSPAITIGPDATIPGAARLMNTEHVSRLPVVDDDGKLVGIVSRRDMLSVFLRPDADIAHDARQILDEIPLADAKAVIAEVRHGVVTLTGTIRPGADHEQDLMPLTVRLIWDIDGVVDVVNRLG